MPASNPSQPLNSDLAFCDANYTNKQSISQAFAAAGSSSPYVTWDANLGRGKYKTFQQFEDICNKLSDGAVAIPEDALDLSLFGSMQDWLVLCKPIEGGQDFVYEHFGKGLVHVLGRDLNRKSTDEYSDHVNRFIKVIYRDVVMRKRRVTTAHQPSDQLFVSLWWRSIVPVCDAAGNVVRILVQNFPENELRAGLEIIPLPVLILDNERRVCYSNKSARQTFDQGKYGPWDRTLFEYAGLDLEIQDHPEDILASGMSRTTSCRYLMYQRLGEFQATISAALYRERAFYVVLLQQLA